MFCRVVGDRGVRREFALHLPNEYHRIEDWRGRGEDWRGCGEDWRGRGEYWRGKAWGMR